MLLAHRYITMMYVSTIVKDDAVAPVDILSGTVSSLLKEKWRVFCCDDCLVSKSASKFINAKECHA